LFGVSSNLEWAFENLLKFVDELGQEWHPDIVPEGDATTAPLNTLDADAQGKDWYLPLIPGVELTSVPPRKIAALAEKARSLGAKWVVVHGETIMEPVAPGTNRAAIEAKADLPIPSRTHNARRCGPGRRTWCLSGNYHP
jgi:hypothetical protein